MSPGEIQKLFDAYLVMEAHEALALTDEQYPQFLTRLRTLQETRRRNQQERVQLIKHLSPLPQVKGLANELEQVFTNLILNAKDAVKAAKDIGTIEIETFERNGSVCAQVKDDGIGIPKEHLSKIFDPFFTTKDVGKGTGLGLSIIYGIIEKHGGKIEVSSSEGKGSTFTVTLPRIGSS